MPLPGWRQLDDSIQRARKQQLDERGINVKCLTSEDLQRLHALL